MISGRRMRAFRAVGGGRIVAHPSITLSATLVAGVTQLVISALAVRTKPQAPRSLQYWLTSSFVAGIVCESQEVTHCDSSSQNDDLKVRASQLVCGELPGQCGRNPLPAYQSYLLRELKLCPGSVENHVAALRFFFVRTLHRHQFREFLPYPKTRRKLPNILSQEEVARLINASSSLFQRTLLMVLYGTGMRRSELARVKIAHIDSQRMIIHVVDGKGHKDRDLPLSPTLLDNLRVYWRWLKPRTYLFPSRLHRDQEQPISDKAVWVACTEAARKAGLRKPVSPHQIGRASCRERG